MTNFCVSLTSLPSRIHNIEQTLDSLYNQTLRPNKIFLNLPFKLKRFSEENFDEEKIRQLKRNNLEIIRCNDYGPGTKLMGSYKEIKNNYECVILIDDDHIYHERTFEIFISNFAKERSNYSFYVNKIFNINYGQGADGFLINTEYLSEIDNFYEKYVANNKNLFLDDDLWIAIYLYCEKNAKIKNLNDEFKRITNESLVYKQSINHNINALKQTEHNPKKFINRRKIQKIEYIKYRLKKIINL
tara:strand:+ start:944 stop:1675 length:732 start_codon:yes stop_codon:yes gene_type:complete